MDSRFLKTAGVEVFTGNELLVKGCLEVQGGTHLWTGYPGSPVAGFFDTASDIKDLLNEKGIRATIANNEALGVAMVNGSQMHGLRAISIQKSVGVHVASDALALGNLVGAHPEGGAVIVLGDDPWSDSTQVPADSRFICRHLMMPVLEPGDMQELKDWVEKAFIISRESELYIGFLVTTNQADGGGSVEVHENHFPAVNRNNPIELNTQALDLERTVLLPPRTWRKEQAIHERFSRLWASALKNGLHTVENTLGTAASVCGFITSGSSYLYLRHALAELGLEGKFPILKLGITYPLDPALITDFARGKQDVIVVEERRSFIEEQICEIIMHSRQMDPGSHGVSGVRVWGKTFPDGLEGIPATRGLNPSLLIELLGNWIQKDARFSAWLDVAKLKAELELIRQVRLNPIKAAHRTPTFCPGCPHRDSASVLVEIKKQFRDPAYMLRAHGRGPVDLLFHGDTGCYTMLMFEPTKDLMHNYSGMGLGGGTGAGIDPFITNKQAVFMGDSTFFHSGQLAISNSIKNRQDITYIILDNKTTAMTGHQTTPSLEESLTGELTFIQSIDKIVDAISDPDSTGLTLVRINPEQRENYRELLEKTILQDGVKVIVADKECGITFHRREARQERKTAAEKGFLPSKRFINITSEVCENCLECTKATGCPGLTFTETAYGRKVRTDLSWCVADGACTRFMVTQPGVAPSVKACPSFEEIVIERQRAPKSPLGKLNLEALPLPARKSKDNVWHGYLAGVGGMGIGTATAILVLAGHREGLQVRFCDKKGLAIRNGGVYSMVTFSHGERFVSNVIPYGKADLIIGVDILEAARAFDPGTNQMVGSADRTAVIVNTHKTPTILTLLGRDDFSVNELQDHLRASAKPNHYWGLDIAAVSEHFFATQLYANVIMLGLAWQHGLIPLSYDSLAWAVKSSLGKAAAENLKAFALGRYLALHPEQLPALLGVPTESKTFQEVLVEKTGVLQRMSAAGPKVADAFHDLVERAVSTLQLDSEWQGHFARRLYDCVVFEDLEYAGRYAELIKSIHAEDNEAQGFEATKAAIWNLSRAMVIKDEVYVAHLLTSEEKRREDHARYQIDPANGDRIIYRHLNRPAFNILGFNVAWDMVTKDWMLNFMKRMKWLRRALPVWHSEEKQFAQWYIDGMQALKGYARRPETYSLAVAFLSLPKAATGYREIRYPKMQLAYQEGDKLLKQIVSLTSGDSRRTSVMAA